MFKNTIQSLKEAGREVKGTIMREGGRVKEQFKEERPNIGGRIKDKLTRSEDLVDIEEIEKLVEVFEKRNETKNKIEQEISELREDIDEILEKVVNGKSKLPESDVEKIREIEEEIKELKVELEINNKVIEAAKTRIKEVK